MKVIFEDTDIEAGRLIQKHDCGLSGLWMIGWRGDASNQYGLISMADGMFVGIGTKEAVANHLNKAGYYLPAEVMHTRFKVATPSRARIET